MQSATIIGGLAICLAAVGLGQEVDSNSGRRLYEVTTELNMPHLDDNLRYTITHEQRCLAPAELRRLFPIMQHPALAGCHLSPETAEGDLVHAEIVCDAHHDTTGGMQWQPGIGSQSGVLHIRLGGKNMTFSQRVSARDLGPC